MEPGSLPTTADQYAAALKRMRADVRCPSCSREGWLPGGQAGVPIEEHGGQKVVVHVAVCDFCGFVRQHTPAHLTRPN